MSTAPGVAIVGTGFSRIARHADVPHGALVAEACQRAVDDAGVNWSDVDGLACFQVFAMRPPYDQTSTDYVARTFDLRHARWTVTHSKGAVGYTFAAAIAALSAGLCNYALVWEGVMNPPGQYPNSRFDSELARGEDQFTAPYGASMWFLNYVFPYTRYAALYGATREKMASFIVDNRANAALNPDAVFYKKPITRDDYLTDPPLTDLLSRLDCDMPVDGCGAVLLARTDLAKDLRHAPAHVAGYASHGFRFSPSPLMTYDDFASNARLLATMVWQNSGMTPRDIDCAAIYDGFSHFVPMWLEAFGFCGEGEGLDYIGAGKIRSNGELPVNIHGGSLGCGRVHGVAHIVEAARQVQGRAGPLQTNGAAVALANIGNPVVNGVGAFVLTRDRP